MEKYLATIHPNGTITKQEITLLPELDKLKSIVGGWIELVPYFNRYEGRPCVAFCNEEGKLHGMEINPTAQALWVEAFGKPIRDDYLVGPIAVIVGPREFLANL